MNNPLDNLITIEKIARNFGFDWPNAEMILDQVISECQEIREALLQKEPDHRIQEEIGDLLHTAISLCLFAGYNVDQTLGKVTNKFEARINSLKTIAKERGLTDLKGQSMAYMLELWQEVKKREQSLSKLK